MTSLTITTHTGNVLKVIIKNIKQKNRKKYLERVVILKRLHGGD